MNFKFLGNIVSVVIFAIFVIGVSYIVIALEQWTDTKIVTLPADQKIVSIEFHDNDLYYLTRDMTEEDSAITYQLITFDRYQAVDDVIKIVEIKH
jgi:LPS O-antigen subunit length determinant protein (WzzB/FepE family)